MSPLSLLTLHSQRVSAARSNSVINLLPFWWIIIEQNFCSNSKAHSCVCGPVEFPTGCFHAANEKVAEKPREVCWTPWGLIFLRNCQKLFHSTLLPASRALGPNQTWSFVRKKWINNRLTHHLLHLLFVLEIHWREEIDLNEFTWRRCIIRVIVVHSGVRGLQTAMPPYRHIAWHAVEITEKHKRTWVGVESCVKGTALTGGGGGCRAYSPGTRRHNATGSKLGQ